MVIIEMLYILQPCVFICIWSVIVYRV